MVEITLEHKEKAIQDIKFEIHTEKNSSYPITEELSIAEEKRQVLIQAEGVAFLLESF